MTQHQLILPDKRRIKPLDSLRGIAAMAVVFGHLTGGLPYMQMMGFTPLYVLRAGHEAVIFFFILSGYVLVYQYGLTTRFEYRKFLIMRFFRLYIPYAISILISLILITHCQKICYGKEFFGELWHTPLDSKSVISHFFLINDFNTNMLNPVIWSLVHEMRISLVFPLLLIFLRFGAFKAFTTAFFIAIVSALSIVMIIYKFQMMGYLISYLTTAYYFYIFIAGGLIAKYQDNLLSWYNGLGQLKKVTFSLIAFLLYCYAHTVPLSIANLVYIPGLVRGRFLVEDFFVTIGSFYFVVAAIGVSGSKTWLENKVLLFLGKISYSLYLVHLPIMLFIYYRFYGKIPTGYILMIGFVTALLIAVVFNMLIEQQAVKMGKRVLLRLFPFGKQAMSANP